MVERCYSACTQIQIQTQVHAQQPIYNCHNLQLEISILPSTIHRSSSRLFVSFLSFSPPLFFFYLFAPSLFNRDGTRLGRSENITTGDNAVEMKGSCAQIRPRYGEEGNDTLLSVVRAAIIFWKQISVGSQLDPHTAVCPVPPIVFYTLSVGIYATQCPLHRARSLSLWSTGVCIVKTCWSFYGFKSRG